MGERGKDKGLKRRSSLRNALLVAGAGGLALGAVSCASIAGRELLYTPAVARAGEFLKPSSIATLESVLPADILVAQDLEKLAKQPAVMSEIGGADVPTRVLNFRSDVSVNVPALTRVQNLLTRANFPELVEAYRDSLNPDDYFSDQGTVFLGHNYSPRTQDLIAVGLFPNAALTHSRTFMIVGNDNKPEWADAAAVTNHVKVGNGSSSRVAHVTTINVDALSMWSGDLADNMTFALATEISQAGILVVSRRPVNDQSGLTTEQLAQTGNEVVANGFGLAAAMKARGASWVEAKAMIPNTRFKVPGIPKELKPLTPPQSVFDQLPGEPLATINR